MSTLKTIVYIIISFLIIPITGVLLTVTLSYGRLVGTIARYISSI